jgi:phosphomannomutase/phosphoglucomutase
MIDSNAPLGLEENGGFFYGPHIPVRDGAMTTALVLDALSSMGSTTFSKAIGTLPSFYQRKAKFECPNDKKKQVMEELVGSEKQTPDVRIDRTDGLKVWVDPHSWILLRPSGTEPLIRVYAESDDPQKLESMYIEFEGRVKGAIGGS